MKLFNISLWQRENNWHSFSSHFYISIANKEKILDYRNIHPAIVYYLLRLDFSRIVAPTNYVGINYES